MHQLIKNKNKKYKDNYLLDSKDEMQNILQQMKFIFIDAYPQTEIRQLMNI